MLFQADSPKLEMWAFPLDTNDVVKSLETMERKIEMGIVSRQAEKSDFSGHQDRGDDCQACPECGDGKDGRPDGCGCLLEGVGQRCFQKCPKGQGGSRVLLLREEGPSSLLLPQEKGPRRRTVEGFEDRRLQRQEQQ